MVRNSAMNNLDVLSSILHKFDKAMSANKDLHSVEFTTDEAIAVYGIIRNTYIDKNTVYRPKVGFDYI